MAGFYGVGAGLDRGERGDGQVFACYTRPDRVRGREGVVMRGLVAVLLGLACAVQGAVAGGIDALRWQRRLVVVAAPAADDPRLLAQRRALAGWPGAADRDVTVVAIVGGAVEGADDTAAALRGRLALPADRFGVVLVGKDGHVALRSAEPVRAAALADAIDAMPMRRAGQR
ncbi:MAG: DUF4174 domain-containing protein [Janthinobacterium lividum]